MNGLWSLLIFVLGCVMLVMGITGISLVSRRKARRRNQLVLSLEEFLGYRMNAAREREFRMEIASRALVVFGSVMTLAAYLRL